MDTTKCCQIKIDKFCTQEIEAIPRATSDASRKYVLCEWHLTFTNKQFGNLKWPKASSSNDFVSEVTEWQRESNKSDTKKNIKQNCVMLSNVSAVEQ